MPKYGEVLGYKIFVWSNEGKPLEPVHVHVSKNTSKNATKFWILKDGSVKLAYDSGELSSSELSKISKVLELYSMDYVEKWEKYFGCSASFFE